MCGKLSSVLFLPSVCSVLSKKKTAEDKEEVAVKKTATWDNTTHVESSAPNNKLTVFKYANRSM